MPDTDPTERQRVKDWLRGLFYGGTDTTLAAALDDEATDLPGLLLANGLRVPDDAAGAAK